MRIGHIYLADARSDAGIQFASVIQALGRLEVEQHVLVASVSLARQLQRYANVTVGPVVRTPLMAYCLMPEVDIAHVHDDRAGQAGLLLTLTRSVPFVMTAPRRRLRRRSAITRSVSKRARSVIARGETRPGTLVERYQRAIGTRSKLPQDADRG